MNTDLELQCAERLHYKKSLKIFLRPEKVFEGLDQNKDRCKQHTRRNFFAKIRARLTLATGVSTKLKLNIGYSFKGYGHY